MRITTVAELKKAIKTSAEVVVQIKFGVNENWVKISKKEAMLIASSMKADDTPEDMEMYTGDFGHVDSSVLYLG